MIERFNFYDIYGYLLPGLAALGVGWFPFWLLATRDLPAGWSSAFVAAIIAYLLGHVLKPLATGALWRDQPSSTLLNTDGGLPETMRVGLIAAIHRRLGIQVGTAPASDPAESARRQEAFFACRSALLQSDAASYAEQFEALYVACRGVSYVAILAIPYWCGWIVGRYWPDRAAAIAPWGAGLLVAAIVVSAWTRIVRDHLTWVPKALPWLAVALLMPAGAALGAQSTTLRDTAGLLTLGMAVIVAVFLASRFYEAYREFAGQFARTVYRDFYVQTRIVADRQS